MGSAVSKLSTIPGEPFIDVPMRLSLDWELSEKGRPIFMAYEELVMTAKHSTVKSLIQSPD